MAFGQLREWFPNIEHVDPRYDDKYPTGSKYGVVSVTRFPTYHQLRRAGQTVANSRMLGLIQSFNAPQSRPVLRLYELGSRYPYSVPGKFTGMISLSSMFFDAAGNMLGNIYSTVYGVDGNEAIGVLDQDKATGYRLLNRPNLYVEGTAATYGMEDVGGAQTGTRKPGIGNVRMSLDDNAIDKPFGLILSLFQSEKRLKSIATNQGTLGSSTNTNPTNVSAFPSHSGNDVSYRIVSCLFFEMVRIDGYNFSMSAESEFIPENASFVYTGLVNVKTALESGVENFDRTGLETTGDINRSLGGIS